MYFLIKGTPYNDTVCEVCGPDKFSPDESATQICSPCLSYTNGSSIYFLIKGTPYNDTVCEVCGPDKFSPDESATQICSPCLSCVDGEEEERECNSYTDRVCKPKGKHRFRY